jgi:hypothetical protein
MYDYRKEIPLDDVMYETMLPEEEDAGNEPDGEQSDFAYEWRFPV